MFEKMITGVEGHIKITDKTTGKILVDQPNAIHYGNMSWAVANALAGTGGVIRHMIFGNGGSSTDSAGRILYRLPNTSNIQDPNALPYNPTFFRLLEPAGAPTGNNITVISGFENFADLVTTVTIGFGEPADQDANDEIAPTADFVFDELALYTTPLNLTPPGGFGAAAFTPFDDPVTAPQTRVGRFQDEISQGGGRMLTHVIFHPVQKAANREIEIEYTLRVSMGP
jgi:hypothetical protein